MNSLPTLAKDTIQKELEALRRGIPVTRMVDYGAPLGDALRVHRLTLSDNPPAWDDACESLANHHLSVASSAIAKGHSATARSEYRSQFALLQIAQLAFNTDCPRKVSLYKAAYATTARYAALAGDIRELNLQVPGGTLFGWEIRARENTRATVIVVGGLSGWGSAYLEMGYALAARGISTILAEGPGQGLTRMESGLYLSSNTLPLFGKLVDHAAETGDLHIGVWGNSFGGLFAAHMAAADSRVKAVCVNGAPSTPAAPSFRTPREQLCAALGVDSDSDIEQKLLDLRLEEERHHIEGALLVLEGGSDPLVPVGSQESFFRFAQPERTRLIHWEDGEHTIYNHAGERNAVVADWFKEQLI